MSETITPKSQSEVAAMWKAYDEHLRVCPLCLHEACPVGVELRDAAQGTPVDRTL